MLLWLDPDFEHYQYIRYKTIFTTCMNHHNSLSFTYRSFKSDLFIVGPGFCDRYTIEIRFIRVFYGPQLLSVLSDCSYVLDS